jgi:flagellar protein FlaG
MADQVNPTGSLAQGVLLTLQAQASAKPQPVPQRPAAQPTASQPARQEAQSLPASAKAPETAVQEINDYLKQSGSDLSFSVDRASGLSYFQVVDTKTKEVIRQVPSEEVLAMARKLRQMAKQTDASGILLDKEG